MHSPHVPIQRILLNPEEFYEAPEDVLRDEMLDDDEKLTVLKVWADEIMQLEIATSENMDGPASSYLARIFTSIEKLTQKFH